MRIAAIPTTFAGVRFRSRLEAKWAAFFDAVEWPWEYEPHDLDGYVPDFLLRLPFGSVAVEVKPIAWDDTRSDAEVIDEARRKFLAWDGPALIVGAFVQERFGELRDDAIWTPAATFRCLDCGRPSFCAEDNAWICRVNGCDGGRRIIDVAGFDRVATFRAAANRVQWRPAP